MVWKSNTIKLVLGGIKLVKKCTQFNKDIMKSYNEDSDIAYVLEIDDQYPKRLDELHRGLLYLLNWVRTGKVKSL